MISHFTVQQACEIARIPFVVHFHGYDASKARVLDAFGDSYRPMFHAAAAVVAGCTEMAKQLIALGAPSEKVVTNYVSTVDVASFTQQDPGNRPPHFVSIGRFVEKKAPHLTLFAFSKVADVLPDVELVMIGQGRLLDACKELAKGLGVENRVRFLGPQSHEVVCQELAKARCFVQHSVIANDGDREGTAISVLEAAATGMAIVATRHQGILDTMVDGETALLVDEFDVDGMADCMIRVARDPSLARCLGAAARERVSAKFSMEKSISGLYQILSEAVRTPQPHSP